MRKKNPKYNLWLKRRVHRIEKRRLKRKKTAQNTYQLSEPIKNISKPKEKVKQYKVTAPTNFSLKDNLQEMIDFFGDLLKFTNSRREEISIFFDLSEVTHITVDAIIYLLAVIKDLQISGFAKHYFYGNLPKNKQAKDYFVQSGFMNYVKSNIKENSSIQEQISILSNNVYDQTVTKTVCDFVSDKSGLTRVETKFLYVLINEMMLNTYQHAYKDSSKQTNNWYMYVENTENKIKFTFLDTGQGIPNTVRKKFMERVFKRESDIILSALNGEFRTQTGRKYRGKGLPKIKECVMNHNLDELFIISNKAFCELKYNNEFEIKKDDLSSSLRGTIYYWELKNKGVY